MTTITTSALVASYVRQSCNHLREREIFWRNLQPFLEQRGYMLRVRYHPQSTPTRPAPQKPEDGTDYLLEIHRGKVLDAIRMADQAKVVLKKVKTSSQEISIGMYFSSALLRNDPRNHCIPILDVIPLPGTDEEALIVMPYLRAFDHRFEFKFEYIDAVQQCLEGLLFMHQHNVTHLDACWGNIVVGTPAVIPDGSRPKKDMYRDRSEGCALYYFIDFGLSSIYPNFEERGLIRGRVGQDKTVPEFSDVIPFDPFKVDIYQLGGILEKVEQDYVGLDFLHPLVESMRNKAPDLRPEAKTALEQFWGLVSKLSEEDVNAQVRHARRFIKNKHWSRPRPKRQNKARAKPFKSIINSISRLFGKRT